MSVDYEDLDAVRRDIQEVKEAVENASVSLRDRFALVALSSMLEIFKSDISDYAERAYRIADEMMKAREK